MSDLVPIGRLGDAADEIKRIIGERTGYIIEIIDDTILSIWASSSPEDRRDLVTKLIAQTKQSALEVYGGDD